MRAGRRKIRSGRKFNNLFPKAKGEFVTISKNAFLKDTLQLMPKVVNETLEDTAMIASMLEGKSIKQTCRNIWNFCFHYLQYERDESGKEQVRRPARSWKDRIQGVDCDCMTVFIASILVNLNIPYTIRLTKDKKQEFEHVYPVVKTAKETIIIDAVLHEFNREAPYREKKDIDMELQYLNGVGDGYGNENDLLAFLDEDTPMDAEMLWVDDELSGRAEREARKTMRRDKRDVKRQTPLKERIRNGISKGVNAINKVNPATALLRGGVLAAMKLNIGGVASKLRFAYLTESQARVKNIQLVKYRALLAVKTKFEKIFFGAGGKKENLRKAILTGKGNLNRMVQLSGIGQIENVRETNDLYAVLGGELYYDEFQADDSLSGLGVVGTATAISAASGVIAVISKLINQLGDLFQRGTKESVAEQAQNSLEKTEDQVSEFSLTNIEKLPLRNPTIIDTGLNINDESGDIIDIDSTIKSRQVEIDDSSDEGAEKDDSNDKEKGNWITENPLTATVIGVGAIGAIWYLTKSKSTPVDGVTSGKSDSKNVTRKKKTKKIANKPLPKASSTYKVKDLK